MSKYLVLYRSSVRVEEQMGAGDVAPEAGMELWHNWTGRVGGAMVDLGSPLRSLGITTASSSSVEATPPYVCGFSVLEADSPDDVAKLLDDHPHFHAPGDPSIEVLEYLQIPGM